jgi:hypothetical protein
VDEHLRGRHGARRCSRSLRCGGGNIGRRHGKFCVVLGKHNTYFSASAGGLVSASRCFWRTSFMNS